MNCLLNINHDDYHVVLIKNTLISHPTSCNQVYFLWNYHPPLQSRLHSYFSSPLWVDVLEGWLLQVYCLHFSIMQTFMHAQFHHCLTDWPSFFHERRHFPHNILGYFLRHQLVYYQGAGVDCLHVGDTALYKLDRKKLHLHPYFKHTSMGLTVHENGYNHIRLLSASL